MTDSTDNADVIERAAEVFCDSSERGQRWATLGEPFRDIYRRRMRSLAAAGLLATTGDTPHWAGLDMSHVVEYQESGRHTSARWYVLPNGTVLHSRAPGHLEISIHHAWELADSDLVERVASAGGEDNAAGSDRTAAHSEADRDGEAAIEAVAQRMAQATNKADEWTRFPGYWRHMATVARDELAALAALRGKQQ